MMVQGTFKTSLRYDNLEFTVSSPVESHLTWLEEFLHPHFELPGAASPSIALNLVIDLEKYECRKRDFVAAETIPTFTFDSKVGHLPYTRKRLGWTSLYDETFSAFYDVSDDRGSVEVLIAGNRRNVRTPLMRIVREFAMNAAQQQGDFFLHASCFISDGCSYVVTGPKNAGKTTLLIQGCRHGGGQYLANDRVRIGLRSDGYTLRGIPAIVSIRENTFTFFPEIKMEILKRGYHFRLNTEEGADDAKPPVVVKRKVRRLVNPVQFCSLMRTRQAPVGKNPTVVMPRITGRSGTFHLRRLRPDEAYELLEESLFGARYWAASTPVFNKMGESGNANPGLLRKKCRSFAERVPFYSCAVGDGLYRSRDNARSLIRSLQEISAG